MYLIYDKSCNDEASVDVQCFRGRGRNTSFFDGFKWSHDPRDLQPFETREEAEREINEKKDKMGGVRYYSKAEVVSLKFAMEHFAVQSVLQEIGI